MTFRIFATCDIGSEALDRLRGKGWSLEVFDRDEPPPRELILEKVRGGVDALVTTLRDRIDEEVFAAGREAGLKVVAQMAVGVDNIDRAAANRHRVPFTNTPDVLTEATAEFAFFLLGCVARKTWPSEQMVREQRWSTWHPYKPWLGDEVTGRTVAVIGTGRIGRAFVKKAVGFDMDVLCHSPRHHDDRFVDSIRAVMEVRHREGLCARLQTIQ
jgi:glyoxylate reductase